MYENDVRRTAILGQYGTAVRSVHNCSENTNVYGVRPFTIFVVYCNLPKDDDEPARVASDIVGQPNL